MQKILIVEDDIDIQDILKNHLIDAGYEVAVASDGVAGIAMFDDTIDLLLLDIMLPKIDGYENYVGGDNCHCLWAHDRDLSLYIACPDPVRNDEQP